MTNIATNIPNQQIASQVMATDSHSSEGELKAGQQSQGEQSAIQAAAKTLSEDSPGPFSKLLLTDLTPAELDRMMQVSANELANTAAKFNDATDSILAIQQANQYTANEMSTLLEGIGNEVKRFCNTWMKDILLLKRLELDGNGFTREQTIALLKNCKGVDKTQKLEALQRNLVSLTDMLKLKVFNRPRLATMLSGSAKEFESTLYKISRMIEFCTLDVASEQEWEEVMAKPYPNGFDETPQEAQMAVFLINTSRIGDEFGFNAAWEQADELEKQTYINQLLNNPL